MRISVSSSTIDSVDYDDSTLSLEIMFKNGTLYQYFDVPRNVFEGLLSAGSQGQYFNAHIKGHYRYARA